MTILVLAVEGALFFHCRRSPVLVNLYMSWALPLITVITSDTSAWWVFFIDLSHFPVTISIVCGGE